MSTAERIKEILKSGSYLLDREEVCKMIILALVADESIFLYGQPGTAKSMTANWAAQILDTDKYFSCLLNQYTQPDELFGPVSIKSLEDGKRTLLTEGYMPEAEISFLDEIWKAGPAILNTLLTICNEKIFKNGNTNIQVPLKLLMSASNEFPSEDSGLEPLYDRFLIRLVVNPVARKDSFVKLVTGKNSIDGDISANPISKEELENWKKGSSLVDVPKEITDFLFSLRLKLNERGIYVSDRRWKKIVNLLKTSAYLNGRGRVAYSDLFVLENVLWSRPEEMADITNCVLDSISVSTVKGSFSFTDRISGVIEKLKTDSQSNMKYDELSTKIDSENSYLDSLKMELESAKNGGENFWRNIFSGLTDDFVRKMMDKGVEMLREFISESEAELEDIRFSRQPKVMETFESIGKDGVAPTVILQQRLQPETQQQEQKIERTSEIKKEDDEIVDLSFLNNESNSSITVENIEQNSQQTEKDNIQNSPSQNENASVQSSDMQNQAINLQEQNSEIQNNQENEQEDSSEEDVYRMMLSRLRTFGEFVGISHFDYTGDSSDRRYKWNDNINNGEKWWNIGSRFYHLLDGDRNILAEIESECEKRGASIGGEYQWVFAVCYIFEKNDGKFNWKTKAELEWLLGSSWRYVEKIFSEAL